MKIVLDYNNGYNLTINENGTLRTTDDLDFINSFIINIRKNVKSFKEINGDLNIYIDNNLVVLKNYKKNSSLRLYNYIIQKLPTKKKVSNVNTKFIAGLTAFVLSTSIVGTLYYDFTKVDGEPITTSFSTIKPEVLPPPLEPLNWEEAKYHYFEHLFENIVYNDLDDENFDLVTRISQVGDVQNYNNSNFPISSNVNEYLVKKVTNFINNSAGKYCLKYCEQFGVDPYLFVSLLIQESSLNHTNTIPGGKNYNGAAVGICQLERPSGQIITAYNHTTNNDETVVETLKNATDLETNIKIGVMIFQNRTNRYNGNIYLTLQSYNYGVGAMDLIVDIYAKQQGISRELVLNNYDDNGWMDLVQKLHDNPKSFASGIDLADFSKYENIINYFKKWNGTYGDGNYANNVLANYIGKYSRYYINDLQVDLDLTTGVLTKTVGKSNIKS